MARQRTIYVGSTPRRENSTSVASLSASPFRRVSNQPERLPYTSEEPSLAEHWKRSGLRRRLRRAARRHRIVLLFIAMAAIAVSMQAIRARLHPLPDFVTPDALGETLSKTLAEYDARPSVEAVAYDTIIPSVVRVSTYALDPDDAEELGVGTGVVIVDTGVILTALHVVSGAARIGVTFADGSTSAAAVTSADTTNDLAVLQASVVPEGLPAATMGASSGLHPGDPVVVVGNPFGVGPSASAGIVSGLDRSYLAQDGTTLIDHLIQFDAAANPGNSGGPLVNRYGEVLGIVSSILNPTDDRVFIGIGFAVPIETAAGAAGPNPF